MNSILLSMPPFVIKAIGVLPPLFLSVILHEIAHGWVAGKLGDPTAKSMGRITLNPLRHIDPFMTIVLPALLIAMHSPFIFGGAKPVPINPRNLKNPRRDMIWVALAGPVVNFALAFLFHLLLVNLHFSPAQRNSLLPLLITFWLAYGIIINLVLGVFNLLPIPPLDGGRIVVGILPEALARRWARLERFGLLIVIALLASGVLDQLLAPLLQFLAQYLLPGI